MSRKKVWYTKIVKIPGAGPATSTATSGKMASRIAWALKQVLTQASGFAPDGIPSSAAWVTYSSSNGNIDSGPSINGDRWTNPTTGSLWDSADSLPRAPNGTAHGWCILKSPSQLSFDSNFGASGKKQFYMGIDLNMKAAGDVTKAINSFTFSYDEPSTPTGTYRSPMSQNSSLTSYWGWDVSSDSLDTREGSRIALMAPVGSTNTNANILVEETCYLNVTVADDGSFYAALRSNAGWHPYYQWFMLCVKVPFENMLQNPLSTSISPQHNIYTFMSNWVQRGSATSPGNIEEGFSMNSNGSGFSYSGWSGQGNFAGHKSKKLGYHNASRGENSAVLTSTCSIVGYDSTRGDANGFYWGDQFETSGSIITHPFIVSETGVLEPTTSGTAGSLQRTSGAVPVTCIVPDFYFAPAGVKSNQILESDGENYLTIGQLLAPISTGIIPF